MLMLVNNEGQRSVSFYAGRSCRARGLTSVHAIRESLGSSPETEFFVRLAADALEPAPLWVDEWRFDDTFRGE